MPRYKTHVAGGLVAFISAIFLFSLTTRSPFVLVEWALWCVLGSIFPDIDIKSKGQQIWYPLLLILVLLMLMQKAWMLVALAFLLMLGSALARHRGVYHNLWFVASVCGVFTLGTHLYMPTVASLVAYDCAFFLIGVASHVALDLGPRRMWLMRW